MRLPIYNPRPVADRQRERLIKLLSNLLNERLTRLNQNVPPDNIVLSNAEVKELNALIGEISTDRSFFTALSFVDGLAGRIKIGEEQLRELYLSERRRRGYSRAVSSNQWHQFITRLGMHSGDLSTLIRAAAPMPFEHFLRMERRVLSHFKISEDVQEYLLELMARKRQAIEALREQASNFRDLVTDTGVTDLTKAILKQLGEKRDNLSSKQVAGLTIVIVDSTTLFTTRDWSVSGTLSTMAGGLTMIVED
ncbi:hypothetical protein [Tropicimonas sp. IMCC6043]|uniref:hypothetical protein n=1 Tax=Tropicimonas sp. IMCC6043 TaxID=2510645 RepID=UPI00101B822B|nr:hypothetical protein [Tropicimonas sp. IMCC6043]RYH09494.1 hypothetical protein EU800_12560 [Tropicimonas sp. IMCC6043]